MFGQARGLIGEDDIVYDRIGALGSAIRRACAKILRKQAEIVQIPVARGEQAQKSTIWGLTISPPLSPDVLVRLRLTSTRRCETHLASPSSRPGSAETHLTLPAGNWL
uniref:Uncharacterized protein n=1 Tax=Ananas comosus var. bracteatus TaxID=296719 RepID=A0A6V7QCT3_ANACO|nr:unnamed protein product [Ananas comosus var. bracteatus]